ncbi:MAG: hypothetical protein M3395_03845 [Chloroflexota bacterium]|nr:hypothetical protein [Chloroflexota bacterium]
MTNEDQKPTEDDAQLKDPNGDDTEGHSLMVDPTTARQLSRAKEQDVDRAARDRQRQKEARGR